MDMSKVGNYITILRSNKGLTQKDLGDRLGVSYQAVSKWERGESLPDTALLPDLANVLETTIDHILTCDAKSLTFRGKISVSDMINGIKCLAKSGEYLGKDNLIYRSAIDGINSTMNTDIEACFSDDYIFEAFVAETVMQHLKNGAYVDVTDVRLSFRHDHFRNIILNCCKEHGIT